RNSKNTKRLKPILSKQALIINPKKIDITGNNSIWDLRFTDGSSSKTSSAGAILLPLSNQPLLFKLNQKNNYLAELTAIYLAIYSSNSKHNLLIYTDSMSSLMAISNAYSSRYSRLTQKTGHHILLKLKELLQARRGATVIDYIPSHLADSKATHSGKKQLDYRHQHNKTCDHLAAQAHTKGIPLSIETLLNPQFLLKDKSSNQPIQGNIGKTVQRIFNQR